MKCLHCYKKVDFLRQIKEWSRDYGDEAELIPEFPIMINIICKKCQRSTAVVWVDAVIEEITIKDPTGKDIKMPKSAFPATKPAKAPWGEK